MRYQKFFITGGSSGIGKATATLLVAQGAQVAIAARGEERLRAAEKEIQEFANADGKVFGFQLDIADAAQVESLAPKVIQTLGGLDVLINNAGIVRPGHLEEQTAEVFTQTMNVNFLGAVHVTRAFLEHFKRQGSGNVCLVTSMLGFMGVYGYSAYAASKFALSGFAECLRQELLAYGVETTIVYPPNTDTPQHADEQEFIPAPTRAITDGGGLLKPEQVARIMLKGIDRGKFTIVPGHDAWFTWFMFRHFPGLIRWLIDLQLKRGLKRSPPPRIETRLGDASVSGKS